MSDIWLITGGCRSGKSMYAENLAKEKSAAEADKCAEGRPGVLYIATGTVTDEEMAGRIKMHRSRRPEGWETREQYKGFKTIGKEFDAAAFGTILLDCIGNMLMGILYEECPDADACETPQYEKAEKEAIAEIDTLCAYAAGQDTRLIFVTNEIGMGLVPETRYAREFRDSLGRINIHAGQAADKVVLMAAGFPVTLK